MTTKAPSSVKSFPDTSLEKQVYTFVDSLQEYMPIDNDRNRLSYGLIKYLSGEGDPPEVLVQSTKVHIKNISASELAQKLTDGISKIK